MIQFLFAELDQNQMKFILDLMIIIHIVVMSSLTRFMLKMCESCSFAELRSEWVRKNLKRMWLRLQNLIISICANETNKGSNLPN